MDTFTHGLIGALVARTNIEINSRRSCLLIIVFAAAIPDIDYLLFWLDPYQFIAVWHRNVTHSLVMVPFWGMLMSLVLTRMLHNRIPFKLLLGCCCLGLTLHIVADLVTLYGVQLFAPFSNHRYALNTLFDIDLWVGFITATGALFAYYNRRYAIVGLLAVSAYFLVALSFQLRAQNILESRISSAPEQVSNSYAIPQPLVPFHWRLIIDYRDHYEIANLSLFAEVSKYFSSLFGPSRDEKLIVASKPAKKLVYRYQLNLPELADFQSAHNLKWKKFPRFGGDEVDINLVRKVWGHDSLSLFRRFAIIPALYRIDHDLDSACIWFTDLRYVFPLAPPPFRYGMCRESAESRWELFRIKRQSENDRQLLVLSAGG